ncbi:MAG TPA: putative molybdenum carrier protein [Gemmatimonadales bacterium]|nr:putative molybdenum carrier protein [Gemmatimonadales bacterium]
MPGILSKGRGAGSWRPGVTIVSGGQTGVDRAALDVARELGLPCGGWCPAGRRAEDGPLPERYPLRETPAAQPAQRTAWNVRDSDATLVLARGAPGGGTALALLWGMRLGRPTLVVDLGTAADTSEARHWLRQLVAGAGGRPLRLNVAGPREREAPGVYHEARRFLLALLRG